MQKQAYTTMSGETALSASTKKTLLQMVAAAQVPVEIYEIGISVDAAVFVTWLIEKQTTAGTMSSVTPTQVGVASETLSTTAQEIATVEPTGGADLIRQHSNNGLSILFPSDKPLVLAGGERLGIAAESPDGTVNALAWCRFAE